jgi:hypothetical protein
VGFVLGLVVLILLASAGTIAMTPLGDNVPGLSWNVGSGDGKVDGSSGPAASGDDASAGGPGSGTSEDGGGQGSDGDSVDVITASDLTALALRGSDLPPGWRTLDSAGDAATGILGTCLSAARQPAAATVVESFRRGSTGPMLSSILSDHGTERQAKGDFDTIRSESAKCSGGDGRSIEKADANVDADDSFALAITLKDGGASVDGELIVIRVGRYTASTVAVGLTSHDLDIGPRALAIVGDRLR